MIGRQSMSSQYFTTPSDRPFDEKSEVKVLDTDNFPSIVSSLRRILQTTAQTNEEKFKILEERDKLYKIMKDKDSTFKKRALAATCPDMCPEKERLLRDYQGRGSMFEMSNYSKTSTFNHCLAVKEYARSSADQEEPLPHDLRPINVLMMTMSHLLHNVVDYCELSDDNLEEWYMFMWDRTRALRKELTQQRLCNLESVTLVEQCARFHIHCAERLIDQDSSIYDDKINTENLTKCLQTLKYMYKDLAKEEIKCVNEPEFVGYSLLLNLNNSSVFTELSNMSSTLMTSEPVRFALDVMSTWETRNYIRFFNLVKKTTYLNCCLLMRYFGEMRLYAIKTMIRSYCTKTYSPQILVSRFVEMLNFDGEVECVNFLSYCNFTFLEIDGRTAVNFDRIHFQIPNSTIPSGRAIIFIEEKKQKPLSVIMAGGTEPPHLYKDHIQQNSFTPNGELDPELPPQKELIEFFLKALPAFKAGLESKNDYNKPSNVTIDIFPKTGPIDSSEESKLQKKEETTGFSPSSLFSFKKENIQSSNIFGAVQTFGKVSESSNAFGNANFNTNAAESLFNTSGEDKFSKNIFGNQGCYNSFNFNKNLFGNLNQKTFPVFNVQEKQTDSPVNNSGTFLTNFQPKVDVEVKLKEEREMQKKLEKEKLERERIEREKEEEKRRKEEEEERMKIFRKKKQEEENRLRELERKEREKREEEERQKREELARREREERNRQEEEARRERLREANAKHLAELKRQEEKKRRIELEHKRKVDSKMKDLKTKMRIWKTKIVFDKWRMKTWTTIEGRKMVEYFKEVKLKYPPVCTEEMLNGNPHGLLIPSVLTFEKFRNWKKEFSHELSKKMFIVNDELPLLKIDPILGKILEERARSLKKKLDPFFWKLVISVPDELESPKYSKSIETFVEMHFVQDSRWQFGLQSGPLYCRSGSRGAFRFNVSIRRLRGSKLFEGIEPNPSAMTGSNALIFFEDGNALACNRLKAVLKSRHPLPKIPVIVFPLGDTQENLAKLLELESSMQSHISKIYVVSAKDGKQHLVAELIKCLRLAVAHSSPPSSLRITKFSKFFSELWLDSFWRRVEIGLSNYKIILNEPKILIKFYNSCLEKLEGIFLDKNHSQLTVLAPEFSNCNLNFQTRTSVYEEKLKKLLNDLKLPHWPAETPKSCHQLNYRIHQYCKKVSQEDKLKTKNLKWILYRIIRQSLLWKGLDIYCNEDINKILTNFPWIMVFQEVSRVIVRQVCEKFKNNEEDLTVTYDIVKIEEFNFDSSFISKFFKKSKELISQKCLPTGEDEEEFDDLSPCLEKDSIVYAYTAAIERETSKRKREECYEESLDALFSSPAGKRLTIDEEITSFDASGMETKFENLDNRLDEIKKRMTENFETLTNIYKELQ